MLEENWQAVTVFRRCRPSWVTGMHAPVYDGIAAVEIDAAARLYCIPTADYPDLLFALDVLITETRLVRAKKP